MNTCGTLAYATCWLLAIVLLVVSGRKAQAEPPRLTVGCECQSGDRCGCKDCWCGPSYVEAWWQAVKENKPLLVFVRQPALPVPGCICCRHDGYPGASGPRVYLGLGDGQGGIDEVAWRDSYPTVEWLSRRVGELLRERKVRQTLQCGFVRQPYWAPTGVSSRGACAGGG